MLVLSRLIGESIQIGDNVTIKIEDIRRQLGAEPRVKFAIAAPKSVEVKRLESVQDPKPRPTP